MKNELLNFCWVFQGVREEIWKFLVSDEKNTQLQGICKRNICSYECFKKNQKDLK